MNKSIAENSFDAVHNIKDHPLMWIINRITKVLDTEDVVRTNCGYIKNGIEADFKDEYGQEYIITIEPKRKG